MHSCSCSFQQHVQKFAICSLSISKNLLELILEHPNFDDFAQNFFSTPQLDLFISLQPLNQIQRKYIQIKDKWPISFYLPHVLCENFIGQKEDGKFGVVSVSIYLRPHFSWSINNNVVIFWKKKLVMLGIFPFFNPFIESKVRHAYAKNIW
jgi:hypothetical protein